MKYIARLFQRTLNVISVSGLQEYQYLLYEYYKNISILISQLYILLYIMNAKVKINNTRLRLQTFHCKNYDTFYMCVHTCIYKN